MLIYITGHSATILFLLYPMIMNTGFGGLGGFGDCIYYFEPINGNSPEPNRDDSNPALFNPHQLTQGDRKARLLKLIQQILQRREQVLVFCAFRDWLDVLSVDLIESGVRHCVVHRRMPVYR